MPDNCRVLLVEDDEDDYLITRDLLAAQRRVRFELDWCATYDDGLAEIQGSRHDAYLIDYRLGERTGLELVREAFGSGPRAPVILLTAQDDYEIDLEATALGVADYVTKQALDSTGLERAIRYAISHTGALTDLMRSQERYTLATRAVERFFVDVRLGMALTDSSMRWVRVNPALCLMLDYPEDQLVGHSPHEFTHPDDIPLTGGGFEMVSSGPASGLDVEKRYIARDGSVIWVSVTISTTHDPETGERLHIAQIQNITERKRAELAYAEERHLFDAFLARVPEQVYFKDLEGRFLRVSDVHAARLGYANPDDLIGKTDFELVDEHSAARALKDEQRVIRTGEAILDVEERAPTPANLPSINPQDAWVMSTKMPLRDVRGVTIGTFGVSRDITLRKRAELALSESESRWRTLLAHLQEIVVLADEAGRLTYATPSMQRWLGYDPGEMIGSALSETSHPDDTEAVGHAFGTVEPGRPRSLTHRVRHRDGSWHTLQSTLISLRHDPIVQAVLIASIDITDHVALEQERERVDLERRVSHRLEAVGQLAAGIAHEINTPLQFVGDSVTFLKDATDELLGLTARYHEMLWDDGPVDVNERRSIMRHAEEEADVAYLTERIPAAFERTADGVSRVRSIVQAMKRFSHANSGTEFAPADLNEAIQTTLEVCRNEYKYVANIKLDLGELPFVTCNIGEINQVLLNLIVNAAQAIEEQDRSDGQLGQVTISTEIDDQQAVITIADDGPGIPTELRERIYEPFFTTKEVGKGTGQGLALARTTINRHSGSLECVSAPGEGTTFLIRLPLRPPVSEAI